MKNFLFLLLLFISVKMVSAQERKPGTVSLTVTDNLGKPVEGASVSLFKAKDSVLFRTGITESSGTVLFENISSGNFFCTVSHLGFITGTVPGFELQQDQSGIILPAIQLLPKSNTDLKSVTVTAKKPFIQKLSDRIVVNVEGSIMSTGSSVMEVLERSPGVIVDQNDIISLRGKQGVLIMIDGKPTAMSGADLANYLKGLPSSAIERIDIITNPSAKYDAAGNAGIIDIRMKKDRRLGSNGSFNSSYGQGVYPKQVQASVLITGTGN
jgi:iron complex outermembrane receptor protein